MCRFGYAGLWTHRCMPMLRPAARLRGREKAPTRPATTPAITYSWEGIRGGPGMDSQQQQYCLKWNSFGSNLATSFANLWNSESLADVTLFCEDAAELIIPHETVRRPPVLCCKVVVRVVPAPAPAPGASTVPIPIWFSVPTSDCDSIYLLHCPATTCWRTRARIFSTAFVASWCPTLCLSVTSELLLRRHASLVRPWRVGGAGVVMSVVSAHCISDELTKTEKFNEAKSVWFNFTQTARGLGIELWLCLINGVGVRGLAEGVACCRASSPPPPGPRALGVDALRAKCVVLLQIHEL
ncbi:Zinc finger protein chinmo [Eumeta japonica]|uniref:Zinc finger protein chinmo n=1 Tax=Eumeta variegata TaxID=151549 RepID=A0A4C1YKV9_EUMVA|nr:Zinc finger protein chinmo [Eumeta japonica]